MIERVPWTLIEKVTEGPGIASSYLVDNAIREFAAYGSELLDDLGSGVRAPLLLASDAGPSGRLSLWLEEIPPIARPLDAGTLLAAARDLGGLAGRWVDRVPRHPWLFTGWIDRHSQPEAAVKSRAVLKRRHPLVVERLGDRLGGGARLLDEQARVRRILESLPQTLCHHDAVGANVFRADGKSVLIDWESVGSGPVGADLASLLFSSVRRGDCSAELAASVVDAAMDAYVEGVKADAPWVTADIARRGFDASVALRWKLVADVAEALERGSAVRRGSAPGETREQALAELDALVDQLLTSARRVLG